MLTVLKPSVVKMGHVLRLMVVVFMLFTAVAALPHGASAKTSPAGVFLAQGASWEAHPQSQKNKQDDEDDEEDSKSSKKKTPTPDADEDDDAGDSKSSKKKTPTPDADEGDKDGKEFKIPRDWKKGGVVSEFEYESPQFGFTAEWEAPWAIDDYYDTDDDDETASVISDEDNGLDEIKLWDAGTSGLLTIQGAVNGNGSDAQDVQEYWESDEYYDGFSAGAELLLSDGDEEHAGVLFLIGDAEDGYIGYNEVTVVDGGDTLIALYFRAPVADFVDAYESGQDGVQVNGDDVFDILKSRDIKKAIRDLE